MRDCRFSVLLLFVLFSCKSSRITGSAKEVMDNEWLLKSISFERTNFDKADTLGIYFKFRGKGQTSVNDELTYTGVASIQGMKSKVPLDIKASYSITSQTNKLGFGYSDTYKYSALNTTEYKKPLMALLNSKGKYRVELNTMTYEFHDGISRAVFEKKSR